MTYQEKQKQLFDEIEDRFKRGENPSTLVPQSSNYAEDNKICLASVVFVDDIARQSILTKVISPLKLADNRQYYYHPNSFHLTITNIRTVNDPPLFSVEDIEKVKPLFRKIIPKNKTFKVYLKGLFELPSSLAVRAYSDEVLGDLVKELRNGLDKIGVPDNKKYASNDIFFSNVTICRYINQPNGRFFSMVKSLKTINLGEMKAEKVSLITTNSVCHPTKTQIIETFELNK